MSHPSIRSDRARDEADLAIPSHASTHILMSKEDLAVLARKLGPDHDITTRVRSGLADIADPALTKYRAAAMRQAREGDLEIDCHAVVSKGSDPGAYVMAWLWSATTKPASAPTTLEWPHSSAARRAPRTL